MSQREKEAAATLAYAGILLVVGIVCCFQHSTAAVPWVAGPVSLVYALFIAISHGTAKRNRSTMYDERDAAIAGRAWHAALLGAVSGFALYAFGVGLVCGGAEESVQTLMVPWSTLPLGAVVLMWSGSAAWAMATLYPSRFVGIERAD